MSKSSRCPFHVKQGIVDASGNLVLSDICGIKAAGGGSCSHAPFQDESHKKCSRYMANYALHMGRQMMLPKGDLEYLPELGGSSNFSELELM